MKKLSFILFLFISFSCFSQSNTPVSGHWTFEWLSASKQLRPPQDTTNKNVDIGSIAIKGLSLYIWSGTAYVPIPGGSGSGVWGFITGTLSAQTDLQNALNLKINVSDTNSMLSHYLRSNLGVKYTDTATMLSVYLRSNLGVKYSDTGAMLTPYLRIVNFTKANIGLGNVINRQQVVNMQGADSLWVGAFASLPSAATGPSLAFTTDTLAWYWNDRTSYHKMAGGSGGGGGGDDSTLMLSKYQAKLTYVPLSNYTQHAIDSLIGFTPYPNTNPLGFISANQSISFSATGDATGTGSGSTSISVALTVGKILGITVPAATTGNLRYNGTALIWDNTHYLVGADTSSLNLRINSKYGPPDTIATLATQFYVNSQGFIRSAGVDTIRIHYPTGSGGFAPVRANGSDTLFSTLIFAGTNVNISQNGDSITISSLSLANPMTTAGDMIYDSIGNITKALHIGSIGQIMVINSLGLPSWQNPTSAVNSVAPSNASLLISPTSGSVLAAVNPAYSMTYTVLETFNGGLTQAGTLTLNGITYAGPTLNGKTEMLVQDTSLGHNIVYRSGFFSLDTTGLLKNQGWVPYWDTTSKVFKVHAIVGSTNTSVGSGFAFGINGTNNIKSLTVGIGILADSNIVNQVNLKSDTSYLVTQSTVQNISANKFWSGVNVWTSSTDSFKNQLVVQNLNLPSTSAATFSSSKRLLVVDISNGNVGNTSYQQVDTTGASTCNGCFVSWNNSSSKFQLTNPNFVGRDTVYTITSGSSSTVTSGSNIVRINPSSTLSSYTLTLPATWHTSNDVLISFGGTITSGAVVTTLTIIAGSGQTLLQSTIPVTANAGEIIRYHLIGTVDQRTN